MSRTTTIENTATRLVRFNPEDSDNDENDGQRKSRRTRKEDPSVPLDPLGIPLVGPRELRVREDRNATRGRGPDRRPRGAGLLSGWLQRKSSKSNESEGSDQPKESASDPEGKRTGAKKKSTFGRERSKSYTSQSSQSSRSSSRERQRGESRHLNPEERNPLRSIASTGGKRPNRPPPPHWGVKQESSTKPKQGVPPKASHSEKAHTIPFKRGVVRAPPPPLLGARWRGFATVF